MHPTAERCPVRVIRVNLAFAIVWSTPIAVVMCRVANRIGVLGDLPAAFAVDVACLSSMSAFGP